MTSARDDRVWVIDTRRFAMSSPRDALRRVLPVRGALLDASGEAVRPPVPSNAQSSSPPILVRFEVCHGAGASGCIDANLACQLRSARQLQYVRPR